MADTTTKQQARALDLSVASEQFLSALSALQKVRAAGIADALVITDAALGTSGARHIAAADIGGAMSTIDALPGLLAGHLTNLTKMAGR